MEKIICVTNRKLCQDNFLERVKKIAACHPEGIILREKDLSEEAYKKLAAQVLEICKEEGTKCILHSFVDAAIKLQAEAIHLPLPLLREMTTSQKGAFSEIGASCHSVEDAVEAQKLGCTYITAGHIFDTDCKKGLPGRGHEFLRNVCRAVTIPVYAIGGITPENAEEIYQDGASGACLMSSLMTGSDIEQTIKLCGK